MVRASQKNYMKCLKLLYSGLLLGLASCSGLQSRYHTIESGDSFVGLAKRYDVPLAALRSANPSLKGSWKAGEKVYIPFEANPKWEEQFIDSPSRETASVSTDSEIPKVAFQWPVRGQISSRFGARYMRGRGKHFHEGIDIAARKGTPVKSARSGHVVYATNKISGYGNMVIVQHADAFSTVYAHLTKMTVKKGQFVTRGQVVGTVGRTGRSTGHHLHFEVRNSRRPIDPLPVMYQQFARNP
jgi:murein DD-endopeptidase MepM/ murein hydrolase activator NlpD